MTEPKYVEIDGKRYLLTPVDGIKPTPVKPTELVLVVDRSGSINSTLADAQGGLDTFIAEQKALGAPCFIKLHDFDTEHTVAIPRQPLQGAPHYTIVPRGGTALYDAIGRAINATEATLGVHSSMMTPSAQQPNVIMVICTDGQENSSREYNLPVIRGLVEARQQRGWSFVFLGVNIDAYGDGGRMGMLRNQTVSASTAHDAYRATSAGVTRSRMTGQSVNITDAEKAGHERTETPTP